jgi:hypothetical protein
MLASCCRVRRRSDHGSRITDHGSRITDHGSRITDHGSRITDHGSRITDHGSRILAFASLLAVALALTSCGSSSSSSSETDDNSDDPKRRPTAAECDKLRDHIIDARYPGDNSAEANANKQVMRGALGAAFASQCMTTLTLANVKCAMAAKDAAGIAECSPPPPTPVVATKAAVIAAPPSPNFPTGSH